MVGDWTGSGQAAVGGRRAKPPLPASVPALTQAELQPMVEEAISRWADAGLDAATLQKLTQVQFVITDLPGSYLGETQGNKITIDSNAAGYGWFVDPTPALDDEFAASQSGHVDRRGCRSRGSDRSVDRRGARIGARRSGWATSTRWRTT